MRLILLVVMAAACSGSGSKSASGTLDPAKGGTVGISDGSAVVVVGPGALAAPTQITVTSDSATPPAGLGVPVSGCFRFGPEGLQFQSPVTITLAVDGTRLPAGSALDQVFIATAPAGSSSFSALGTSASDASHVAAETSHFSVFCAVSPPVTDASIANDLGDLAAAPSDGPAQSDDLAMPSSSPSPSCSPYPTPPPSPPCTVMPPLNQPIQGCGWQMVCGQTITYQAICTGNLCYCYAGQMTQQFPQGTLCDSVDGGVNSALWDKCCYPK
jgi:hypothetical protein